jgi:hypothetical protein
MRNSFLIDRDKIPTVPCKQCLIKPICKSRVKPGLLSISLRCSILNEWLRLGDMTDSSSIYTTRLIVAKFEVAYKELSLSIAEIRGIK